MGISLLSLIVTGLLPVTGVPGPEVRGKSRQGSQAASSWRRMWDLGVCLRTLVVDWSLFFFFF